MPPIPNDAGTILEVFIIACLVAPLILFIIGFAPWGVIGGSLAALIQSCIGNVAAGSIFAFLQSLATAPIFAGLIAGGITAVTALIYLISEHGLDAVLQSFVQLAQPLITAIGEFVHKVPAMLEGIPDFIKSVILFIPEIAKIVISKILECISSIPGALKDALLVIPAAIKALIEALIGHLFGGK